MVSRQKYCVDTIRQNASSQTEGVQPLKMTFYTNAMFLLESTSSRILCDPWVTFNDKSVSGFYNFPKCSLGPDDVAAIKPDFIYITHTHPDHLDPKTIKLFNPDTPILVAEYEANFTERAVKRLGFSDVRIVPTKEGLALNGDDYVWMEPAANSPEIDSIAVFKLGGQTAVNANDNIFHKGQCEALRKKVGSIDIGLLPSGAHGPWPMFFENLSPEEKVHHAEERALKLKDSFKNYIEAFCPKWVAPIAGGVITAGEKAHQYIYSGIRGRSEVVDHALRDLDFIPVMMSEGNQYDFTTGERRGDYEEKTYSTEKDYLDALACNPGVFSPEGLFYVEPSQRVDMTRLLSQARKTQRNWQQIKGTTSILPYFFDVGEEQLYRLSLGDDEVSRVKESEITDERYEIFRLPYELLLGMLTRHYVWSNVNTQHMTFYRKNERMDPDLMLMLNYLQV